MGEGESATNSVLAFPPRPQSHPNTETAVFAAKGICPWHDYGKKRDRAAAGLRPRHSNSLVECVSSNPNLTRRQTPRPRHVRSELPQDFGAGLTSRCLWCIVSAARCTFDSTVSVARQRAKDRSILDACCLLFISVSVDEFSRR